MAGAIPVCVRLLLQPAWLSGVYSRLGYRDDTAFGLAPRLQRLAAIPVQRLIFGRFRHCLLRGLKSNF